MKMVKMKMKNGKVKQVPVINLGLIRIDSRIFTAIRPGRTNLEIISGTARLGTRARGLTGNGLNTFVVQFQVPSRLSVATETVTHAALSGIRHTVGGGWRVANRPRISLGNFRYTVRYIIQVRDVTAFLQEFTFQIHSIGR